jgi:hypothetical protein
MWCRVRPRHPSIECRMCLLAFSCILFFAQILVIIVIMAAATALVPVISLMRARNVALCLVWK